MMLLRTLLLIGCIIYSKELGEVYRKPFGFSFARSVLWEWLTRLSKLRENILLFRVLCLAFKRENADDNGTLLHPVFDRQAGGGQVIQISSDFFFVLICVNLPAGKQVCG